MPSSVRVKLGDAVTPKAAAPTLVRSAAREGASSASPAKPAKKKVVKKASSKKKAAGGAYASATMVGQESGEGGERDEHWLDEQLKLTQMMNKMYSGGHFEGDDDSSEPDEDHLEYYDFEAEQKALAARVAELKRVSSLPGPSSFAPDPVPSIDLSESMLPPRPPSPPMTPRRAAEEDRRNTRREAAAAARTLSKVRGALSTREKASTAREASPELEPFCIGRQGAGEFEEIEVTLPLPPSPSASSGAEPAAAGAPAVPKLAAASVEAPAMKLADAPAGDPPLTPRSLASSIAARRQANQKLRAENAKVSSPTGA